MKQLVTLEPRTYIARESVVSGPSSTTIEPLTFNASLLMAQIADGWLAYSEIANLADTTAINRATVIRNLGSFLVEDADKALSISIPGPHLIDRLYSWEKHQLSTQPAGSSRPWKLSMDLKNFVKAYLVRTQIDNPDLQRWVSSKPLRYQADLGNRVPLDEFTNSERLLLERSFKDVIRAGEAFLRVGDDLVEIGRDQKRYGDDLPNLAWGVRHLITADVPSKIWAPTSVHGYWKQLIHAVPALDAMQDHYFGNPIIGLAYPHLLHLQALQSLLILKTGWAPEEVGGLKRSDVQIQDKTVRVRTIKKRAQKTRFRELPRSTTTTAGWHSGDLIVRLFEAQRNIDWTSLQDENLWVGALTRPCRINGNFLRALNVSGQFSFSKLINACDIDISRPHDRRRLRKTTKSAKAILLGTLAGSAGDDHSIEVFRNHYAQTTTVHTIAAHTVLAAQELVMNNLGPTVVSARATELTLEQVGPELAAALEETQHESALDRQLSITACIDPTNPPHTTEALCFDAPKKCLECRNAVIFADHIPRLKTYRDILKKLETTMPPQQFAALYGQQIVNIDTALSKFPESSQANAPLRAPLAMRATT